ncbi:MAG TPA: phage integrase SAM-like domain-containing protein [Candidatus Acidoferrum sp.]|nr:phage integrase SAM-like domain-containing protein [Candidatus Acidoferrum sp.]
MNRQVNLTKRVKTQSGLRYCLVVLAANGRIKPNYVLVDGKQEAHPEGACYLEWRNGLDRVRVSVGKDVAAAAKRHRKEAELNGVNSGVTVVSPDAQNGRRSLPAAIADYLAEIKLTKKPKTHSAYSTALEYFQESCPRFCLEDLDRKDLLKFAAFLRDDKEQSQRRCGNKFANVMTFRPGRAKPFKT